MKGQASHPVVHAIAIDAVPVSVQAFASDNSAPSAPPAPSGNGSPPLAAFQNEGGAREFLSVHGFPIGLQDAFIETLTKLPMRFFILDDSGSMAMNDGKRIVVSNGKKA